MRMSISAILIDDESFVRDMLALILTQLEVEVVGQASSGMEGIKLVQTLKPDLVMLDINMPKMLGTEVLKEIKKIAPKTKVVMLSSINDRSKVQELIKEGADYYIIKNLNPVEIHNLLQSFLEQMKERT